MAEHAKMAPDGGPLSNAQIQGVKRYDLVRVTVKATGTTAVIRQSDFNSDLHEKLKEDGSPAVARKSLDKPKGPPVEELASMTVAALKDLPEYALLPDPKPSKKADIVDAIVAARE